MKTLTGKKVYKFHISSHSSDFDDELRRIPLTSKELLINE